MSRENMSGPGGSDLAATAQGRQTKRGTNPFLEFCGYGSADRRTPSARCHVIVPAVRANARSTSCTGLPALPINAWRISFPRKRPSTFPGYAPVRPHRPPATAGQRPLAFPDRSLGRAQGARRELANPAQIMRRRRTPFSACHKLASRLLETLFRGAGLRLPRIVVLCER
jgi:hypothetical protein